MKALKKILEMKQEMTRLRHRLHAEPELAFEERKTARLLIRQLESCGLKTHTLAGTGVVAVLHGKSGPGGKAIMLRSDMDALPVKENTGAVHASRTPGVHHACGHDGHMAMLLGAAKYLAETKNFEGTVYFVFQPAEEHIGGAKEMIKEGLFQKFPCDEVYGLHNYPGLPLGAMATGTGPMLAASDEYHISFKGTGGHSAHTENTADVVGAAAEAILAIKALADSDIPEEESAVMTVCSVITETDAANILPAKVSVNGSVRTYDPALHDKLKEGIEKIVLAAAKKYGVTAELEFKNGYPLLVNTKNETDFAVSVAQELMGEDHVLTSVPKTMGVEDFAYFLQQKPGNFMVIGTGHADDNGKFNDLHSAKYDFNDAALPLGASYWARLVERALPVAATPPAANPGETPAAPKGPKF